MNKTTGACLLVEWLPFMNIEHSQRCRLCKWCHCTAASASVCKSHNPWLHSCTLHFIFLDLSRKCRAWLWCVMSQCCRHHWSCTVELWAMDFVVIMHINTIYSCLPRFFQMFWECCSCVLRAACIGCVLALEFRCKIVCGDAFSSASDALFSVMYFYMTMFSFSFIILSNSCHRDH